MSDHYKIVIPARYESTRLPGKPLLDVGGKTLIERVWDCARESGATEVVIATDDARIEQAASGFGAVVVMTRADHASGSDRIAECIDKLEWADEEIVVNLQGDEPLMPPACLDQVAGLLNSDSQAVAASLYQIIVDPEEVDNPNAVKVVTDENDAAIYFSRAAVPAYRGYPDVVSALAAGCEWKRHIGLYAYRAGALRELASSARGVLEEAEKLEQLRIIESGGRIAMAAAIENIPAGVDTPADLERVRAEFSSRQ